MDVDIHELPIFCFLNVFSLMHAAEHQIDAGCASVFL